MRNTDPTITRPTLRDRVKAHPWISGGVAGAVLAFGLVSCGPDGTPEPTPTETVQPTPEQPPAPTPQAPQTPEQPQPVPSGPIYEPPAPTVEATPSAEERLAVADAEFLDYVHTVAPDSRHLGDNDLLALADDVCVAYIDGIAAGGAAEDVYAVIEGSMLSGDPAADEIAYAILDGSTARCAAYLEVADQSTGGAA